MKYDFHTHTTYSDGGKMRRMVRAAEELGLEHLGFADHANVSKRKVMKEYRNGFGFNLDMTYKRRREAINKLQKETDIRLYDAVEMDYHPKDKEEIVDFLTEANFDYSIGSLHHVEDVNVHVQSYFRKKTEEEKQQVVDKYFEMLVEMIESEIFDIAAHIDLIERNPVLRGKTSEKHYQKVAEAFKNSKTIPEINAGRATYGLQELHPLHDFQEVLEREGVTLTMGSDSHTPQELKDLTTEARKQIRDRDMKTVNPF